MIETQLLIDMDVTFSDSKQTLDHISSVLTAGGYVKESYHQAIHAREAEFPTGIDLGFSAVAIPHCDATHANKPCVYLIKPSSPVTFERADGEGHSDVALIIALVVTDPAEQMQLLRALFSSLQDEGFFNALRNADTKDQLKDIFSARILHTSEEAA